MTTLTRRSLLSAAVAAPMSDEPQFATPQFARIDAPIRYRAPFADWHPDWAGTSKVICTFADDFYAEDLVPVCRGTIIGADGLPVRIEFGDVADCLDDSSFESDR